MLERCVPKSGFTRRIILFRHVHATKSHSRSVRPLVGPSVKLCDTLKSYTNDITVPAHPYATDAVVYTALFVHTSCNKAKLAPYTLTRYCLCRSSGNRPPTIQFHLSLALLDQVFNIKYRVFFHDVFLVITP